VGARSSRIRDGFHGLGGLVKDAAQALSWELGWTGKS
jgi:hypothetical protein